MSIRIDNKRYMPVLNGRIIMPKYLPNKNILVNNEYNGQTLAQNWLLTYYLYNTNVSLDQWNMVQMDFTASGATQLGGAYMPTHILPTLIILEARQVSGSCTFNFPLAGANAKIQYFGSDGHWYVGANYIAGNYLVITLEYNNSGYRYKIVAQNNGTITGTFYLDVSIKDIEEYLTASGNDRLVEIHPTDDRQQIFAIQISKAIDFYDYTLLQH